MMSKQPNMVNAGRGGQTAIEKKRAELFGISSPPKMGAGGNNSNTFKNAPVRNMTKSEMEFDNFDM